MGHNEGLIGRDPSGDAPAVDILLSAKVDGGGHALCMQHKER